MQMGLSAAAETNLGFLATLRFRYETQTFSRWISLDSLVRIETYQWVIRDKLQQNFFWRRRPLKRQQAVIFAWVMRGDSHFARLPQLLISCNRLPDRALQNGRFRGVQAVLSRSVTNPAAKAPELSLRGCSLSTDLDAIRSNG
jgi:hypothetical protein